MGHLGAGHRGPGMAEAPLTLPLVPHRPPTAAGTLLLLGGPGSALQLLLPGPAGPLRALAAVGGAAGGEPQQCLLHRHLPLSRALGQQLPEPQRGAQRGPQDQLRGQECPRGPERRRPAAARVKICKEKAAQLVQSLDNDVNPVVGSGSGVHQHQFQTDSPSAPPGPDGASPVANEEQELHYAFIRFHNLKHQEDANIVYSEIKTHK
uniref:Sialic acid binding Ig like lectin 6 n=1 Tax=Molossus molossus TaxID=27622 RepID=A0A7J8CAY4_MOLMO|nr:sialic acid binding Ig like lectin 6 [Molossus molossus]